MKRSLIFLYGVLSYAIFFVAFLYAIGFVGNVFVPKSIDSAPIMPLVPSLAINLALLAVFAIQHSGMARPAFKRWLTKYIPESAERSTYVLMSTVALVLLMAFWAPLGGVIWDVTHPVAAAVLTGLYFASWGFLLYSSFLIDHFDLFGLRQVFYALRDKERPDLPFMTRSLYRFVRHPIYVGWFGIVWFTPTMTVTHLLFAVGCSLYMLVGIKLEERDLVAAHPEYQEYQRKVPALVPSLRRRLKGNVSVQSA